MALPSNVFRLPGLQPLPFFSPFPVSGSFGVDVFSQPPPPGTLYAFPPFVMIRALIGLLAEWGDVHAVLVLPTGLSSSSSWLPRLSPFIVDRLSLAGPNDSGVLLLPSRDGFSPNGLPLGFGLAAFLCVFPPRPSVARLAPPRSISVLVAADSMFRPVQHLTWPSPFSVKVLCVSGGSLRSVLIQAFHQFSHSNFDVLVFHGGINDVSKSAGDFEACFQSVCDYASNAIPTFFPGKPVICSSVCQSKQTDLNQRVCVANELLRALSSARRWRFVSHDNIYYQDLSDDVHLNAAGVAKLYRSICVALRAPQIV